MPTTREIALSTPDFLLKLLGIDLGFPSEVYLSKDSYKSNWQKESEVLSYKLAEPLQRDSLCVNRKCLNFATQPTIQTNKKSTIITLKKPKLNIKCISGKTKKRRKRNSIGSFKKLIKLPEAKRAKGKKYYKEG